jgi:hypothetical protein
LGSIQAKDWGQFKQGIEVNSSKGLMSIQARNWGQF